MSDVPSGPYWEFSFDARATQLNWTWRRVGASGGIEMEGGRFADFGRAIIDLLDDDTKRAAIGRRAYAFSRRMVWSSVGAEYLDLFERVRTRRIDREVPFSFGHR